MRTRASIIIKQNKRNIDLYHHFDGYPDGIGSDLKEYLKGEANWYIECIANELVKGMAIENDNGYEVACGVHGDIDYLYIIDCDNKELKCYKRYYGVEISDIIQKENEVKIP